MISIEDCLAMCGLTPEEVSAIAEHEHVPETAASALANYLLHKANGCEEIHQMIVDGIRAALAAGRKEHAADLYAALCHFLVQHPRSKQCNHENAPQGHPPAEVST